jgi:hypothetical protein
MGDVDFEGCVFDTPSGSVLTGLFLFAPVAQEVPITATHQSEAALHQPNRTTPRIVGFPGTFGNVPETEQNDRDRAV